MKTILSGLSVCTLAGLAAPVCADDSSANQYTLEIERQPIVAALTEFSKQTGLQVGFMPRSEREERTIVAALSGQYTAESALQELLAPSGLAFERVNEKTIAVTAPRSAFDRLALNSGAMKKSSFWQRVRLAQAQVPAAAPSGEIQLAAADADAASRKKPLEEVIVTAQKREERLQDVPISISVLGGVDLDRSTLQGVADALRQVPGVGTIQAGQAGGSQVIVRGVTAGGAAFEGPSPIAYYIDSVPFGLVKSAVTPDANAYDMSRVEVLRGPQGTLYGANALNGVVRVLTNDADLDEFEFKARTSGSSTKDGGENYRGDMAVNVPIVDGKLAVRAALGYEDWDGWIDRSDRQDSNDLERRNVRLKVNAQPVEQLSVGLSAWLSRADQAAPSDSDDNQRRDATLDESLSTDYDLYGLKINYDFGAVTLASMTSYVDYESDGALDLAVLGLPPGERLRTTLSSEVFAQEVNLSNREGEVWRWTLGGMYRDAKDRNYQFRPGYITRGGTEAVWFETSESYAVFGELTRRFAGGRFEITGGLRYFEDDVGLREQSRSVAIPVGASLGRSDYTFDATSPRVTLTWHPTGDATVYASYSEGFRSGYDQNPTVRATVPALPSVDADTLTNYELGTKGNLWEGRVNYDVVAYFMDWQDIQLPLNVIIGGTPRSATVNSESASGVGFDVGVTTSPVQGLELGVSFSWNDLALDADVITIGDDGNPVALFSKGDRLNLSPEYTVGASIDYAFPMGGRGYEGRLSTSASYMAELTIQELAGTTTTTSPGDDILISRASFSIDAPMHWSASLFVDNINDEQGAVVAPTLSPFWSTRVRPRTIGLQFEYRFE